MARKLNLILTLLLIIYLQQKIVVNLICAQEYQLAGNTGKNYFQRMKDIKKRIQYAENVFAGNNQLQAIEEYERIIKLCPEHVESWKRLAQLYCWNEMSDKEVACYKKIIELEPVDTETMNTLAQHYIWTGHKIEAIDLLRKVLIFKPENLKVHRQLAHLYCWNNMPEQEMQQYEIVIKIDSTDAVTMHKLANNYFWSGKPLEGIKLLERVVKLKPDSIAIRRNLVQQYVWNEMPEKAIEQYEEIIKRDTTDVESTKKLAQQYMWNNRPADAAGLYEKIIKYEPANSHFTMQLARAYLWSNQSNKAELPLAEVLKQQPGNKEAMLLLAEIQRWSGRWDLAKTNLQKLLVFEPENQKAKELLTGIRQNYGTQAEARYYRISDSNELTRAEIPIGINYFYNRHWEYVSSVAQFSVKDGRLDSTLIGYGVRFSAKYNFTKNSAALVELAVTNYSSSWTPVSVKVQLNQNFFDRLYTNIRYQRTESREGVKALLNKIAINSFKGEFYLQATKRWSFSGVYNHNFYSDDNVKIAATAGSNYSLLLKNPKLTMYGYYAYEDFKNIYPTSLPYWTPDKLSTASLGLNIDQNLCKWLSLGLGYALTNQQQVNSNNFSGKVVFNFSKFDKLYLQYLKNGSDVYNAESVLAYFQHRF